MLTLARPEVADRHPGFPGATRSAATLPLEPLGDDAMDELLTGLVPGLPDAVRRRLRDAADGIPLYAIETVRMLRDRGVLEQIGGEVVVTGDLTTFEVPETLHALIASRLDGVPENERRILQDASVLGKTFTSRGLAALSGLPEHEADPDAADADEVRTEARRWFTRAADRAASLAASLEAQRAFERVAGLSDEGIERGRSLARAGELAAMGGRVDEAEPLLEAAIAIFETCGQGAEAAGAQARLGEVLFITGRIEDAVAQLQHALAAHEAEGDEAAIATVSAELGRFLFFEGRSSEAMPHVERALELSERLRLADVVVQALINKALILQSRPNESLGLMRQALALAEEAGIPRGALRACMNLSYLLALSGRTAEAEAVIERGLALARRRGDRVWERALTTNLVSSYFVSGRWDDVERAVAEIPEEGRLTSDPVQASTMLDLAQMALYRGETERVAGLAAEYASWTETANRQAAAVGIQARVLIAQSEGRHDDALRDCTDILRDDATMVGPEAVEIFLACGCESAVHTADADALEELLALAAATSIDRSPSLEAHTLLHRSRLAALRGASDPHFNEAVAALRAVGEPFWVATALLEQAEWLADNGGAGEIEPLLAEAREVFERLRAQPRLERVERLEAAHAIAPTVRS